jgi:hypothetical protein
MLTKLSATHTKFLAYFGEVASWTGPRSVLEQQQNPRRKQAMLSLSASGTSWSSRSTKQCALKTKPPCSVPGWFYASMVWFHFHNSAKKMIYTDLQTAYEILLLLFSSKVIFKT